MSRRIEAHIARELRCLDVSDHVILIRSILVDYGQRAVGIGGKHVTSSRIVARAVHARSDGQGRDDFAKPPMIAQTTFFMIRPFWGADVSKPMTSSALSSLRRHF